MRDYTTLVNSKRAKEKNYVKFFVHNKCNEDDMDDIFNKMPLQKSVRVNDNIAHIISWVGGTVAYRMFNDVYIIPAKAKPVPMAIIKDGSSDNVTIALEFEYPCKMERKDLVEY